MIFLYTIPTPDIISLLIYAHLMHIVFHNIVLFFMSLITSDIKYLLHFASYFHILFD